MAQYLQLMLISTGVFCADRSSGDVGMGVVAHEVAKDARLIRELHARLCKPSGEAFVLGACGGVGEKIRAFPCTSSA